MAVERLVRSCAHERELQERSLYGRCDDVRFGHTDSVKLWWESGEGLD